MRIRRFNEAATENWDNVENDIRLLFSEYTDQDDDTLKITDCHVEYNGMYKEGRLVIKKGVNFGTNRTAVAKLVELKFDMSDETGIDEVESQFTFNTGTCMTDLDKLQEAIEIVQRFYIARNDNNVNFNIENDNGVLVLMFVVVGPDIEKKEDKMPKVNGWLRRMADLIAGYQKKRPVLKANWLEFRYSPSQSDMEWGTKIRLSKIADGTHEEVNATDTKQAEYVKALKEIRDEAWEEGLKLSIGGGDRQIVIKFVTRE
jgi:hypothetical protein